VLGADVILAVENGEIVERGTHTELLARVGSTPASTPSSCRWPGRGALRDGVVFRDGHTLVTSARSTP